MPSGMAMVARRVCSGSGASRKCRKATAASAMANTPAAIQPATLSRACKGAALTGFGFSLVFPALGVEAVRRVPMHNRGTALGVFTGFSDVSFFLVGPIAGAVIGVWGYPSAFLFALASVLVSLGIVLALHQTQRE